MKEITVKINDSTYADLVELNKRYNAILPGNVSDTTAMGWLLSSAIVRLEDEVTKAEAHHALNAPVVVPLDGPNVTTIVFKD